MGILLCIIGSIFIVLHAPPSTQTETLPEFFSYLFAPGFLVYSFLAMILLIYLVFRLGPLYGKTQPVVFLSITSIGGAFLVNSAQGLGSSIVYSISNPEDTQFRHWSMYPLIVFTLACAVFQINYLNKSLQYFSASIVTPVNYVFFSTATLITSAILYRGFNVSSTSDAIQIIMGFLVIVIGVSLLFQYHLKLNKLERARTEAVSLDTIVSNELEESIDIDSNQFEVAPIDSRSYLSDPQSDIDPLTLWNQTFPLHERVRQRFTNEKQKSKDKSLIIEDSRLADSSTIDIKSMDTINSDNSNVNVDEKDTTPIERV